VPGATPFVSLRSSPTTPRSRFLVGHFRDFRRDPLGYLTSCARTHGDAVALRFVNRRVLLLSDPTAIGEVLLTRHRSFRKHQALRQLARPALGDGLLLSEGAEWQRQRQIAQPAFRGERIAGYAQVMIDHARAMGDAWQHGQELDLHAELMALTSRIVTRCLFGTDLSADAEAVGSAMEHISLAFKARMDSALRLPLAIPTPANRRYLRGMTGLDTVLTRIIETRRQAPVQADLLGALLAARGEDGGPGFSPTQLRDQVATLFFAGHETTANALVWTHWLLASQPAALATLEAELATVLAGREPTPADVPRLRFCGQVLDEAMRLMPPVWVIGREAIEPVELGDVHIARGTTVLMSQWVVHRDPRWYPEPERFLPERWTPEFQATLPAFAYFPFGGGPRICIGNHFARMEMVLLLAAMVARFRLSPVPGAAVVPLPSLTLRPQHGLRVRVTVRGK
jgi:cytochrome P450